jgi:hypothetical protein
MVIVGLHFTCNTTTDAFDNFFRYTFRLPWKGGGYHRSTFEFNPACALRFIASRGSFPPLIA